MLSSFDFTIRENGVKVPVVKGFEAIIFIALVAVFVCFVAYSFASRKKIHTVHRLYIVMCVAFITWLSALVTMWIVGRLNPDFTGNEPILWVLDSLTYIGVAFLPVLEFLIALNFSSKTGRISKYWQLIYIIPIVTNLIVWTNDYHGLAYKQFSVVKSDVVLGGYIKVSGVLNYALLIAAGVVLISSAIKRKDKLFWKQSAMLCIGTFVTMVVSVIATFGDKLTIAATPLSFTVFLIFNYIAIYRLHMLDIVPIATQHVLDYISDGYLILNSELVVIDDNKPFREGIGRVLGIEIGMNLTQCRPADVAQGGAAKQNLLGSLAECAKTRGQMSFEQSFIRNEAENGGVKKYYFFVDITPMIIDNRLSGYAIVFKDITQLRKSLEQVQNGKVRLMEQERLAMLGQMVGGLAHNLKTPIMSIAGCSSAVESLIQEVSDSLGDPEVTESDYREILTEMHDWVDKIRTSCSYMSDIITAIKGQAQIANAGDKVEFSIDDVVKRTQLLMRHELLNAGVTLELDTDYDIRLMLNGDINSLIQVLNNLISNAIYAERDAEDKRILFTIKQSENMLRMAITDNGHGIDPAVRDRLFKEMVTTKGTHGTGLGLYISATTIKGKFGGEMWHDDNPKGGATFGFDIPLDESEEKTDEEPED